MELSATETTLLVGAGTVAVGALAGTTAFYLWLQRPHLKSQVPRGQLVRMFQGDDREQAFIKLFSEYGKTCEMEGFAITCDPALVRELLTKSEHCEFRSRFYSASTHLLYGMSGLLNLDGAVWRKHKEALYPLLHVGNVNLYTSKFHDAMTRHAEAWAAGVVAEDGILPEEPEAGWSPAAAAAVSGGPDLVAASRAAGMEAVLDFAVSLDPRSAAGRELGRELTLYGKHLAGISDGVGGIFAVPLGLWRVVDCTNKIRSLVNSYVVERFGAPTRDQATEEQVARVQAEDDSAEAKDGLRSMWLAGFGAHEMAAEVNHVHGAHKAAGFSIACMLWRLAQPCNAEWVGRLRAEWEAVLGKAPAGSKGFTNAPSRSDVKKLTLTGAVIKEVMRLHVVSLCTGRQTGLPITVDGVTLPPGTEIGIALQAMHTHPDHFSRPNEFCPERWLPADHELASDATANPRAFLPFLSGPRKCAGQQLAEMEHTVGVHAVLDRFDVTSPVTSLRMRADLYSSIESPVAFTCAPRATE
ncbi:hypothetical protein FNF29_03661 [Cafeteria roenbergensis]|uniref:Cytochrome P450 n=1 Tax=Cafeteria roenbergensis TaxID=33653 RepID=A0A5A8CJU2_CAFRO|nr:hypothetical protein FNF29_03661 [Cafeteria roenbergensis]|eukprot:KAA0152774.1 hypothetical protein FNF29_03661 [Cafeteria roenbergensis]